MRKKLVYSLSVLSAMPLVANAEAVNVNLPESQQIKNTAWSGNPTISEGTVLVAEGASVSQSVGELLPGKYVVNIEKIVSIDCDLNINFAGTTKSIKAASTTGILEFDLTAKQDVTITISSAEGKSFQVTNVTLKLNYDFDATYKTFNDALVKVTSMLNQITYPEQISLLAKAQTIQKKINEIKEATYDVYKKYALNGDDATNAIMDEIRDLETEGKVAVNAQYVKQLNAKLSEVYDGQTEDVKKIVKSVYDGIVAEINTFDNNNVVDDSEYQALLAKIDNGNDADNKDLKDKIRTANDTAADNDSAYNDVKDYINGKNTYATQWPQSDGTTYGSAYDIYTDINAQLMTQFEKDRYKNILAAAQKELSLALQKITQAEKDNETFHNEIKSVENQAKLKADVDAAVAAMKAVLAKYSTTQGQLDGFDARYSNVEKSLNDEKKTHKVGLEVSQIKAKLDAAEAAVKAVKDAIEGANVTTDKGKIDETMAALNIDALETAATTAITALKETAAPYTAHMTKIADANKDKSTLDADWGSIKAKAAEYKYDDDLVSNYFAKTIEDIESKISKLAEDITKAENSGKWNKSVYTYNTEFYSSTITASITTITTSYTTYNEHAEAAQDNYNKVVNSKNSDGTDTAVDGLKKLQSALDAANDKVKDLAIYNDQSLKDPADPSKGYKYNYAKKVVDIQAKIDAVYKKISEAKKITDDNHYNVMAGIADKTVNKVKYEKVVLDGTIATAIATIEANYEIDNTNLEAELKAAMLAATAESYNKLVDDINSLGEPGADNEVKYGKSYDAIDKGRTDIKTEEKEKLYGLDKTAAKAAIDAANAEELAKIQEDIQTIRTKLDELLAVAKQAADLVKANQEAQAELIKAIYDGAPGSNAKGNLDKYFADKITNDALVNNATALADADVTPVKEVNKEMVLDLPKAIADLKALVGTDNDSGTDRTAETLAANKEKHLQTIADLKARIDAAKKKAEDCTKNYNKYQEYVTASTGKIAVAQTALNTAVGKANTADAANFDYADKEFVKTYQKKITNSDKKNPGAKQYAATYYKNGTMVSKAADLDNLLKEVTDFAAGLEATATANKKGFDDLNKEWTVVKTLWTSVSTDIAKNDESSAREGFQQELKAQLDKLNTNKTNYTKKYGEIALPDADLTKEQADIKSAINDIKTRSLGDPNYSERIKADNDRMFEVIKATVDDAAKEYNLDTDTLKMFKNVTSTVLTTSLTTVKAQYETLNNTLYKYAKIGSATTESTFVEVVNEKYKTAADEYAATASPNVFDKDSTFTNAIRADIAILVSARESFMSAIRDAIKSETNTQISDYEGQINTVISQLKALTGYTAKISDKEAKAAVKALSDKLAAAKDAVAAGLIPEIDAAFADLQTLEADLAKAKFAAMSAKLESDIAAAETYAKKGQDYLADDADNLAKFNVEVKNGVTKARNDFKKNNTQAKLTDTKYNNIQALIANFVAGGNNTYETIMANNGAWPKIQSYVEFAQNELQTAIDGIQEYAAAGAVQQHLYDIYQTDINAKYNDYLALYNDGTLTGNDAKAAETYLTKSSKDGGFIKDQILNVVDATNNTSVLYQEEYKVIKTNLSELEAEYNKFAASDLTDISKSEEVKTQIENVKKALGTDNGTSYEKANTAAKLLVQQKAIAELMQQLLNANYGEGVSDAATKAELEGDLAKVKSTFDKSKYTEEELAYDANVDLNSQIAQLEANIAAIEGEIEAGKDLSYNKENIANKIAVAQKQATAIETQAKKNKENLDKVKAATAAAYKDQTDSDDKLLKVIEDVKKVLDQNSYDVAKAAAFENMLNSLTKEVEDMKADFAAAQADGVKQSDPAFADLQAENTALKTSIPESLYDIANTASDRQLNAEVADLQAQLDAISYTADDYTLAVQKSLASQKKAIDEAINGVKDEKGKVTTNGLVQDIQNAKMQDYKLVITGTGTSIKDVKAVDPSDDADVITSYVYLTTNGKDNKKGAIAAVQELIDQLKSDINSKKITPEEPEPEVIPGDITGTGTVDDADFDQFVEDLLAGNVPAAGDANFAVYDANGDGEINVGDIQAIFNLSMGLNPDGSDPDAAGVRARAYGIFDAGNMAVEATKLSNGNTMLAVKLSSTTDYLAFQMDVVMGDGMSVVSENANLQLLRSNDLSNIHRIVGYGLLENNGTMLTLEVAGEGNVQFTNIVLATEKAEAVKFSIGGTTGISTIAVEKNDGNFIYDLSGKLMNGIKKGINIIRGKNGETKKVVK